MQKYKKILITGANSFLGTNVALELAHRGINARAIVRHSNATIEGIETLEIFNGNVSHLPDLERAADGCDCIVHIASITDQALPRYELYRRFNVSVISNVIAAARHCGIRRVIYVSSANTIGNGTSPDDLGDELRVARPPFSRMLYGRSKVEAEAILHYATDLDYTILNPTFMLGAHDSKPSSGAIIMMGYARRVIFAPPGGKNIVSVRAAAHALCNAIEDGGRGEKYLLAGENISVRDFFKLLNPRARVIVIPRLLLITAGYFGDILRFLGVHIPLSANNMRVICEMEYYTAAKATRELGLEPTSIKGSIAEAVDWFKAHGML
ncbi:MAG: NAD-dependent epimerase/dehydratase family protein [Mucinivorans sp.]